MNDQGQADDFIPQDVHSPDATPGSGSTSPADQMPSNPLDTNAAPQENQAEQSVAAELRTRILEKLERVSSMLEEREKLLQVGYENKINRSYWQRWGHEANHYFWLAVMLRARLRRLESPSKNRRRDRIA